MSAKGPRQSDAVGAVVIGRNEGDRLVRCLTSLRGTKPLVYVDSGSTDGSQEKARGLGAEVVGLDMSLPFTAARARNAGLARLRELAPDQEYVLFVDGDCEVVEGFIARALVHLRARSTVGVVCGRRRERFPEHSVYNRACDVEWDGEAGDVLSCGGDAVMRVAAIDGVGGYKDDLIAGEEPELCVRLRAAGWIIERIDADMTWHDANIQRFSQWWTRAVRTGHAFAEGASLHGHTPERHWVAESRRVLMWGAVVPAVAVLGAPMTLGASLGLLFAYPLQGVRAFQAAKHKGRDSVDAACWAVSCAVSKFPEAQGALRFHADRLRGKKSGIIEYKTAGSSHQREDEGAHGDAQRSGGEKA
jgi:GT2 family glycosyltransferase